jgi:hypothetical protein
MKEKFSASSMIRRIFILLFATSLFLNYSAMSCDGWDTILKRQISSLQREYKEFFKNLDFYNRIINYIQKERPKAKTPLKLEPAEIIFLTATDLLLSLLSLWLAMLLLTGMKTLIVKAYLWFLFIFNVSRFIFLLLFKGAWEVLEFLIIRLQPNLESIILNNFSIIVIIIVVLIYIWLLARTFSLNFFGALGTFLASHLIYILVIFLFFSSLSPKENRLFNLAKENLGIKPIIQVYLWDLNKIITGQDILSLVRIRPFHL